LEYHVTIMMAGLWPPTPQTELRLGGLELLLARGERAAVAPESLEALLFEFFGVTVSPGDLPVAAVTRVVDMGVVDHDWWIRADPVHLVPQRDGLVLVPPELTELGLDEAQRLCDELARSYATEGWLLRAPHPWRWYLRPPQAPDVQTTPLALAAGRDIHAYLPTGPEARSWHTLLNEIQILLHTARVNAEREQRGALAINSLWFWGGGRLPSTVTPDVEFVWTNDAVAQGLSRLSGVPARPVPSGFQAWREIAQPGRHLIVLDSLRRAMQRDAEAGWSVGLAHLDKAWFRPLTEALRTGAVRRINLVTDQGLALRASGWQLGRWWRRRRPLSSFAPVAPLSA